MTAPPPAPPSSKSGGGKARPARGLGSHFVRFFRTSSTRQPSRTRRPRRSHTKDVNPAQTRHVHKPPAHKATLQKWRATGQSRRRRSISPGAGQPSFGLVRLSAYASGHRACRTCVPCPPRQGGRVRVEAECPRPRKSRSARCGVSTDQRSHRRAIGNLLRTRHYRPGRGDEQVVCRRPSLVVLSTHHAYAAATVAWRATPSICTFDQQREARGLVAPLSPEQTRGGPRGVGGGCCRWNTPHAAQLATASAHLLTALMPGCPARGRRRQTSTRTTLRQCATDYKPPAKP